MLYPSAVEWASRALAADGAAAVDRILGMADHLACTGKPEPHQTLVLLATRLVDDPDATDGRTPCAHPDVDHALAAWLHSWLVDHPFRDNVDGNHVWQKFMNALDALPILTFPEARRVVVEHHRAFDALFRVHPVAGTSKLVTNLHDTLAEIQPDRRFVPFWYAMCERTARGVVDDQNDHPLLTAFLGLRQLPAGPDEVADALRPETLVGLEIFARNLSDGSTNKNAFLHAWAAITARHREPGRTHAHQIATILARNRESPFTQWWIDLLHEEDGFANASNHRS